MAEENPIKSFLETNHAKAEFLQYKKSCHSVKEAAETAGISEDDIVKSICLIDKDDRLLTCLVKGNDRVSTKRVAKALDIERPRIATPEEVKEKTGFTVGGVPPLGHTSRFIIDDKIMEKDIIYPSGGSSDSLIRIDPKELQRLNDGKIKRIRK